MAWAQSDPFFPASINCGAVTIVNSDGTTKKTLFTAGTNGSKVNMITSSSDDSATADLQLWITRSGTDYLLGTKTIAITAGFITGTPAFNWFDGIQIPAISIDADGQRYLLLDGGDVLKVGAKSAVTSGKTHYIQAQGWDF